jgi:hypothetical protein
MREWNLQSGNPLSLTIAADARFGPTDYCNDQVWELSLKGGEPPALALQTTYGLRARSFRLFPRFTEANLGRINPETFAEPPSIRHFAPNYLNVHLAPFSGLEAVLEYWIPSSQAVAGRCRITNQSHTPRKILLEWIGMLTPNGAGQRMIPTKMKGSELLSGISGDLFPVVFLTGGAEAGQGPYPSLAVEISLPPGKSKHITWAQAALGTFEASLDLAQQTANINWEAILARIDLLNSGLLEIFTGNPEWDAAFALAQKIAYGLFVGPTSFLPFPSFVNARQPDHGFSLRGEGLDYNHLWNGQTPFDTWFLAEFLLPASPQLLKGVLMNFMVTAREDGFIDWKPGLGGQRTTLIATPLLAGLVKKVYEYTDDINFLKEAFTALLGFVQAWFSPAQDRDGDGIPEWSHPLHSGLEDHPLFSNWLGWSQGADISSAEGPALCAFLYREIQALFQIAELVDNDESLAVLQIAASTLRTAVEISWDPAASIYRYWDRDSHFSSASFTICEGSGSGQLLVNKKFEQPVRLLIKVRTVSNPPPHPQIFIHGKGANNQHLVEPLSPEKFQWQPNLALASSSRAYEEVEFVSVEGLTETDSLTISSTNYQKEDISLLLPLWAGIPAAERARSLVDRTLTEPERYWKLYGLPVSPVLPDGDVDVDVNVDERTQLVSIPWNSLIGEGLIAYGYRKQAADLVEHLMTAVISSLKKEAIFRKEYHSKTGSGRGEANALEGLAPLGLFLETLGVRIYSTKRVDVSGFNPFPWPVTVKYRGLTVLCQADKTTVIFSDGQTTTVTDPAPCCILLE